MAPLSRSDRLDRLPFTPLHRRILVVAGLGWALDAMDVGLISFVMAALAKDWSLSQTQLSWIGSVGFVGMALGAGVGGSLADRVGRRTIFAATLLVYGVATGAAALIGTLVVSRFDEGWRWAFVLGAVPALYSAVVRRALPESVRFLEQKGRGEEAEGVVRRFEQAAGVEPPPAPAPEAARAPAEAGGWDSLWSTPMRRRTAALWTVWFGINFAYYGAFIWIPTLLVERGFSLVRSFEYTLMMTLAQLPGYAVAAYLIERWGRRPTLAAFLAGSAAAAGLFAVAESPGSILFAGALLSFFNLGAWGALYAATPEVYPTTLRATGAGWAAGFGRIASILAPLAVPPLLARGGVPAVFGVLSLFFGVAIVGSLLLPELRGKHLTETLAEEGG